MPKKCFLIYLQDIANPIIFSAVKNSGKIYYADDYVDSFDKFLVNDGSGFNLETGTFKAPTSGVFEFSASLLHELYVSNDRSRIAVLKNLVRELEFREYDNDTTNYNDGTLSFTWILELKEGDEVRLKATAGRFECGSSYTCTFSGKFIRGI